MRNIHAVIFDMDGLMVDTERLFFAVEREIAKSYGKVVPEATFPKMMGRKPIESMRIFAEDLELDENPAELLAIRDELMLARMKRQLDPMPGLFYLLDHLARLKGRVKTAVCTGATKPFVALVLDKLELVGFFDTLTTSEEVSRGKPSPEIYALTVSKLKCSPGECLVLEDSANGVQAARAAGCFVAAVPSEYTRDQDFSDAHYQLRDLSEVVPLIGHVGLVQ